MRSLIPVAVALLAVVLTAGPAAAAKEETGHPEAAGADHGGKPKVDVAESFGLKRWDLGIYTLIVFLLLLAILGRFAWGPMMRGLDAREAGLRKTHEDAEAARAESQNAVGEVQAQRDRIRREIEMARDQALQDIYQQAVQLAALVSTKAVKRELTPADHSRLLDEALADLRTNLAMPQRA